jgi:hypothetical protein
MSQLRVKFIGFTEGQAPFGGQPLFQVKIEAGPWRLGLDGVRTLAELESRSVAIPEPELAKVMDAQHRFNNAVCDDHVTRANQMVFAE